MLRIDLGTFSEFIVHQWHHPNSENKSGRFSENLLITKMAGDSLLLLLLCGLIAIVLIIAVFSRLIKKPTRRTAKEAKCEASKEITTSPDKDLGRRRTRVGLLGNELHSSALSTDKIIPRSVNYHFTRQCNYKCGFCFHTAKTSSVLPIDEAKRGLKMLKEAGRVLMKAKHRPQACFIN